VFAKIWGLSVEITGFGYDHTKFMDIWYTTFIFVRKPTLTEVNFSRSTGLATAIPWTGAVRRCVSGVTVALSYIVTNLKMISH